MAPFSQQALGQVVRSHRERAGITQQQLGEAAGYGRGAGVAISRLEGGQLLPSAAKLAGVADALGLTLDQLKAQATERTAEQSAPPSGEAAGASLTPAGSSGASGPPGQRELNLRSEAVTSETAARAQRITELSEAYNEQYDRAREQFLVPFDALGARLAGAARLDPAHLEDDVDAAADRSAPTPGAHAEATDPRVPLLGRRTGAAAAGVLGAGRLGSIGVAGVALAGIVVLPAAALLGGGLVWKVRRDRRQRQELAAQLDEAEAALAASKPGVLALEGALPRATATLDYIATHAGHALGRWTDRLGPEATDLAALDDADQRRYQELFEVATAQIVVATIDFEGLLTSAAADRDELVGRTDDLLTQAQATVQTYV